MASQQQAPDIELISEVRPILYAVCVMLALAMALGSLLAWQTLKRTNFNFSCRYIRFSIGNPATAKKTEATPEVKKAPPAPAPAQVKTEAKTQKATHPRGAKRK